MERDATIARDQKRYEKRCHDCQRPKTLWKRCHALPEAGTLCKEMPFIARGFEKRERVGNVTLEKREAMLQKRKDVESHAWGDLKCDRVVLSFSSSIKIVRVSVIRFLLFPFCFCCRLFIFSMH
jgi:hypothetical protein